MYNDASNIIQHWDIKTVTFSIRKNNKILILKNFLVKPYIQTRWLVGGWEESESISETLWFENVCNNAKCVIYHTPINIMYLNPTHSSRFTFFIASKKAIIVAALLSAAICNTYITHILFGAPFPTVNTLHAILEIRPEYKIHVGPHDVGKSLIFVRFLTPLKFVHTFYYNFPILNSIKIRYIQTAGMADTLK